MVLNSLSLSEHLQRENTRKGNSVSGNTEEEDDHTETTFSIDDSFVGFHDDSLKSNLSYSGNTGSTRLMSSGYLPTVAESDSSFEKVPMSWLEPRLHKHNSVRSTTTLQKNNSIRSYVTAREDDDAEEEDDDDELDMRDLLKDSRMMSDCSFKPCHESMQDSMEWDGDFVMTQSGRMNSFFKPQDSMGSIGWGSMRDLSIREPASAYPCKHHAELNGTSSSMLLEYAAECLQDSTFARNMEYLQEEAKSLTQSVTTFTFMRNLETLSMMILG